MITENASEEFLYSLSNYCALQVRYISNRITFSSIFYIKILTFQFFLIGVLLVSLHVLSLERLSQLITIGSALVLKCIFFLKENHFPYNEWLLWATFMDMDMFIQVQMLEIAHCIWTVMHNNLESLSIGCRVVYANFFHWWNKDPRCFSETWSKTFTMEGIMVVKVDFINF